MQLTFEIPDAELERVATAFCRMAGHTPCQTPECLLEQVGRIVVARVTSHERLVAARAAEAGVPPLSINPQGIAATGPDGPLFDPFKYINQSGT